MLAVASGREMPKATAIANGIANHCPMIEAGDKDRVVFAA